MSALTDRITEVLWEHRWDRCWWKCEGGTEWARSAPTLGHCAHVAEQVAAALERPAPWEPDPDWIKK